VAFLRKDDKFLDYNPQTIKRIAERILKNGFDTMIKGIEEPKEFNRQIGTLFKKYIIKIGYLVLPPAEFKNYRGIAFLKGSEKELKDYANDELDCRLKKEPDLLAKAGNKYVIGEAKFLTDVGGHQNAQFADALALIKSQSGSAIRIAILDGVVWIKGGSKMFRQVNRLPKPVMTALLLKEFLENIN
ncbi:MAG: restriction endonuclease, partial [Planctomycetota bacterium]|nr:restriction endonuclease [Planctomycetota bacterium]